MKMSVLLDLKLDKAMRSQASLYLMEINTLKMGDGYGGDSDFLVMVVERFVEVGQRCKKGGRIKFLSSCNLPFDTGCSNVWIIFKRFFL